MDRASGSIHCVDRDRRACWCAWMIVALLASAGLALSLVTVEHMFNSLGNLSSVRHPESGFVPPPVSQVRKLTVMPRAGRWREERIELPVSFCHRLFALLSPSEHCEAPAKWTALAMYELCLADGTAIELHLYLVLGRGVGAFSGGGAERREYYRGGSNKEFADFLSETFAYHRMNEEPRSSDGTVSKRPGTSAHEEN